MHGLFYYWYIQSCTSPEDILVIQFKHFVDRLKSTQCRLTALYLQENHGIAAMNHGILWAGTGDDRIVLIDSKSGTTIASTHRYCGPIRALKSSTCKSKPSISPINLYAQDSLEKSTALVIANVSKFKIQISTYARIKIL